MAVGPGCVRESMCAGGKLGVGIRMQLSGAYSVLGGSETAEPHPPTPNQQMKARNVSLEFRGRQKLPLFHKAQLKQHSLPNKQLYTQNHSKRESNYVLSVTE